MAAKWSNDKLNNGLYNIDPDGAGPIAPLQLYCDMTEGGWMLAGHLRDGPGNDLPDDPAMVISGWAFDGDGKWSGVAKVVDREPSPTANALLPVGAIAAFQTTGAAYLRICLTDAAGANIACRESPTSMKLVADSPPNAALAAWAGSKLLWTWLRLAGLAGSTEAYNPGQLVDEAWCVQTQPGTAGDFGTGAFGLCERQGDDGAVWHGWPDGVSLRPWRADGGEIDGGLVDKPIMGILIFVR